MRNVSQKRQKEVSKRGLQGDWKMWCPEDQEKKMVMKGGVHCVKCCRELVLIRLQNWHSSSHVGAKPGWSRLKSGEELQPMRRADLWEFCCEESRDVMVCSRKWWQVRCKALAMQRLLHMWSSSSDSRKGTSIRCVGWCWGQRWGSELWGLLLLSEVGPRWSVSREGQWERRCGKSKEKKDA